MASIALLFSPFDALGLNPRKQQYDHQALVEAYRIVAKISHPDRRNRVPKVPIDQWPTLNDATLAFEYLTTKYSRAFREFCEYPRSFFPRNAPDTHYGKLEPPFEACGTCRMPLHKDNMSKHLVERHYHIECNVCRLPFPDMDLEYHEQTVHGITLCTLCCVQLKLEDVDRHVRHAHHCPACKANRVMRLRDHVFNEHRHVPPQGMSSEDLQAYLAHTLWWKCPLSNCASVVTATESAKRKHLYYEHSWQDCGACLIDAYNFDDHLRDHKWVQCPYPACGVRDSATFLKHTSTAHLLRQCDVCETHTDRMEVQAEHIRRSHPHKQCPSCKGHIDKESLPHHLRWTHGYDRCERCGFIVHPQEYDEHRKEENPHLKSCGVCGNEFSSSYLNYHLCEKHGYMKCPISRCERVVATEADLKEHFHESHTDFVSCDKCHELQTPSGLKYHRREAHGYRRCLHCDIDLSPDDFDTHIENQHPRRSCPASECAENLLDGEVVDHLVKVHGYCRCPMCNIIKPPFLFSNHLLREHPELDGEGEGTRLLADIRATESCSNGPRVSDGSGRITMRTTPSSQAQLSSFSPPPTRPRSLSLGLPSSQRPSTLAKNQSSAFGPQPLPGSDSLPKIKDCHHELDTPSHVFYSSTPQESRLLVVAATSTEHEYGAKDIGVKLNAQHQSKPMDGSSRFVDLKAGSRNSADGNKGAISSLEVKDQIEAPKSPADSRSAKIKHSARPGPSKLLSRRPKDVYELPSEPGNDPNNVFKRILDYRWQGTTVELLVEWSGAEPSWELEANLHRDAHDALLEFWKKKGGHPENPKYEGVYDIYCILNHNSRSLLVEWTGYPRSEATWEPRNKIKEVAPQVVDQYFASLKPVVSKQRNKRKRQP